MVEFIFNKSGDWTIIKLNGEIVSSGNDSIDYGIYMLLNKMNVMFETSVISDEEMEAMW